VFLDESTDFITFCIVQLAVSFGADFRGQRNRDK